MKYLGIDYCGGITSLGVYDSATNEFILKKHHPIDRVLGYLHYKLYKKSQNIVHFNLLKFYVRYVLNNLIKGVDFRQYDCIVLSNKSGTAPYLEYSKILKKKLKYCKIIESDHFFGHINAVKYHEKFQYPALVIDSSAMHSVVAYLPDHKSIEILSESKFYMDGEEAGLGKLTINHWVSVLNEEIYWPPKVQKGKKNVYDLYASRGKAGIPVHRFKKEIQKSDQPLCEDVLQDIFPQKMNELRNKYASEEKYRNDWVATQQQLLRDIMSSIKANTKQRTNTYFVSGGISMNPAFKDFNGWLRTPDILATDYGAGCFMAYLGFHIVEKGLKIDHDRWKDYIYV